MMVHGDQASNSSNDFDEFMDTMFATSSGGIKMIRYCCTALGVFSSSTNPQSAIAYIDSQASNWVVPDRSYLLRITNGKPTAPIDTAGGSITPDAIGVAGIHMTDTTGRWHYFEVPDVLVMSTCSHILYSQPQMHRM